MRRALLIVILILCVFPQITGNAQDYSLTPVTLSKDKVRGDDGQVYWSHVALERQTLFSIAKAYGVTVDEICDANKSMRLKEDGLKKGSVILIPIRSAVSGSVTPEEPAPEPEARELPQPDDFIIHVVKWYEDIDDIARKYNVPADRILAYNSLRKKKLKSRMKLKIPLAPEPVTPEEIQAQKEDADKPVGHLYVEERFDWDIHKHNKDVKALLMLPLDASGSGDGSMLDFYSGFLLAVRDLGNNGTDVDLSVYDVAGTAVPVSSEKMASSDIVIGPISKEALSRSLELAEGSTPVVSPLDPKASELAEGRKNFIQAPASHDSQYADMARWIREDLKAGDRVVVISENGVRGETSKAAAIACLDQEDVAYTTYSYGILQGRQADGNISSAMTPEGTNRVVVASDDEGFVYDVLRNLILVTQRKMDVVLYSTSRLRSMEKLEVEDLHALNLHVSLSYFIDYDSPKVRDFLMSYRALYKAEPNRFSFQGYDIARYFLELCSKYGKSWVGHLEKRPSEDLLQSTFSFGSSDGNGYSNQGIRRVVYEKDFRVRRR